MVQICEPLAEASSDCAGCFTSSFLPAADFQVVPRSRETSTPPVVAAYQASLPNARSLTWKASCVAGLPFGAGFFTSTVVFLPLTILVTLTGAGASPASGAYRPVLIHLPEVSSYFIKPPLLSEATQPVGAAYTCLRSVGFSPGPGGAHAGPPSLVGRKALWSKVST